MWSLLKSSQCCGLMKQKQRKLSCQSQCICLESDSWFWDKLHVVLFIFNHLVCGKWWMISIVNKLLLCVHQMKTNQMCSFCAGDPKAALIISFEKLCMSPSHKFNQSEIITSCFLISLLHRFTSFVLLMISCSNLGCCKIWFVNVALFTVENLLIWTDAVFSVVFPTLVAQCFFGFFFFL